MMPTPPNPLPENEAAKIETEQEEIEGEIFHEGMTEGYGQGFSRCLELVEWAGKKIGLSPLQRQRMNELLQRGPRIAESINRTEDRPDAT